MPRNKAQPLTKRNILTEAESDELVQLGKDIVSGLACNANGNGLPCRTDRLDAVARMQRYLEIHGFIFEAEPALTLERGALEKREPRS